MTNEKVVKSTVLTSKIEIEKKSTEVARRYEEKRRKALASILGQPQVEPPKE